MAQLKPFKKGIQRTTGLAGKTKRARWEKQREKFGNNPKYKQLQELTHFEGFHFRGADIRAQIRSILTTLFMDLNVSFEEASEAKIALSKLPIDQLQQLNEDLKTAPKDKEDEGEQQENRSLITELFTLGVPFKMAIEISTFLSNSGTDQLVKGDIERARMRLGNDPLEVLEEFFATDNLLSKAFLNDVEEMKKREIRDILEILLKMRIPFKTVIEAKTVLSGLDRIKLRDRYYDLDQVMKNEENTKEILDELLSSGLRTIAIIIYNKKALEDPENYVARYAENKWTTVLEQYKEGILRHSSRDTEEPHGMNKLLEFREEITKALLKEVIEDTKVHEKKMRAKLWEELVKEGTITDDDTEREAFIEAVKEVTGNVPGSDSPTSDIDVNMNGDGTEYAVTLLNKRFRERYGKGQESGIVYDVNFYAQDFVPGKVFELRKGEELLKVRKDDNYYDKDENWRTHVIKDEDIIAADEKEQEIASMLMMRVNMDEALWEHYKESIKGTEDVEAIIQEVEERFKTRQNRLTEAPSMSIENEAYEEVLMEEVQQKRIRFQILKIMLKPDDERIDEAYFELKTAKSKALQYANAAYYSQGAVLAVVANKQLLGRMYKDKSKKPNYKNLKLSAAEYYHAFNEQIGFAIHGLLTAREQSDKDDSNNELVILGKYIHRAYNVMKHMKRLYIDPMNDTPIEEQEESTRVWRYLNEFVKHVYYVVTRKKTPATTPSLVIEEDVRRAASDWEGLKQGKEYKDETSGYANDIEVTQDRIDRVLQNFLKLNKLPEKNLIDTIIENLIHTKVTMDKSYYDYKEKNKEKS